MIHKLSLLVFCWLTLSMVTMGTAAAQEPVPPLTRYLDPLPLVPGLTASSEESLDLHHAEANSVLQPWGLMTFQHLQNYQEWNVYLLNHNGDWIQLTEEPSQDLHPRLNRGATQVVFVSNRTGSLELYRINTDRSGLVQLTSTGSQNVTPAWSPDGRRIAFTSDRDGQAEIYVMDADGNHVQRLTTYPGYDGEPAWSPDGSQIAYVSNAGGYPQVWIMNADGSQARPLVPKISVKPVWSPDGKKIAYATDPDGSGWLRLEYIRIDDSLSYWIPFTSVSYPSWNYRTDLIPQGWSPDGRYLLYTRIIYEEYQANWYWRRATLEAREPHAFEHKELSTKGLEWNPDWQPYDTTAPTSDLSALPAVSPADIKLSWHSPEESHADLAGYQIQMRTGQDTPWIDLHADTLDRETTVRGVGGQHYYFRVRARDQVYNWEAWSEYDAVTMVENWPPLTQWESVPRYTRKSVIDLVWSAIDPGGSGIESYDLDMRTLPNQEWQEFTRGREGTFVWYEGEMGKSYEFRLRARDRAGNLAPWSEAIRSTRYTWGMTGKVVDNAGVPVTEANITLNPAAFEMQTALPHAYAAYVADPSGASVNVIWQKQGYGALPATIFAPNIDAQRTIVLPPANNLLVNSHFEANSLQEGWQRGGDLLPTLHHEDFHTGKASGLLGCLVFEPVARVADNSGYIYQLQVDAKGTAHLIHSGAGQSSIYYSQRPRGGDWSAARPLGTVTNWSAQDESKQMAVDADGAVHIAWTHSEAGLSQFNYINRSTDGTWSAIQQIPVLSPSFSNPRIGVDSSGRVHVIWIEHMAEWEGRVVYARREATGQWSTPGVISNTPPLYGTFAPHLLVSPEGSVHVFWYEKSEHWNHELMRILYRQMRGDGSWQEPQLLANPHKYSNFHLLAKLTQGHLHLVWEEDVKQEVEWQRGIYYRQRDALGNWSDPPQLLSLYHNIGDMAVSETSDLHLLLRRSNDSQIFLMTQRQGGWSLPEPLSDDPIYGRAAITLDDTGTLHVAWVRSNHGVSTPYYQRRTADGSWLPARQLASPVMNMQKIDVASGSGLLHIVWNGDSGLQAISSVTSDGEISTLSQQVTIPAEMASPTLSLQYNGDGFGPQNQPRFTVQVSDAISTATLLSAEENSDGWTHHWRDLSAWQGRPVTVTLRLDQPANQPCASVLVDEVTLGTAYPDLWIRGGNAFSAMPGQPVQYILDYGNRGGGRSSARIHATLPPQVQLVDSSPPATINGNRLSWEILDITERSKSGQIIIKGMVSSGTALMSEVTLAVHIESPLPEPEQSNNKMDLSTFIGNRLLLPVVHR